MGKKNARFANQLTLAFLHVGWFKQINDTFGHSVGDTTLRSIARILQKTYRVEVRKSKAGSAGRWHCPFRFRKC